MEEPSSFEPRALSRSGQAQRFGFAHALTRDALSGMRDQFGNFGDAGTRHGPVDAFSCDVMLTHMIRQAISRPREASIPRRISLMPGCLTVLLTKVYIELRLPVSVNTIQFFTSCSYSTKPTHNHSEKSPETSTWQNLENSK
jgi:hypothetical protein